MDLVPNFRFSGSYPHTVDGKNRVTIPSKWRSDTLDTLYASADEDLGVIKLLTREERERQALLVWNCPKYSEEEKKEWRRQLFGSTPECTFDKEGRIVLPASQLQELGLGKEVMLAGVGETIEVWDRAKWQQREDGFKSRFRKMAKEVGT